jgi:hypothetical protein
MASGVQPRGHQDRSLRSTPAPETHDSLIYGVSYVDLSRPWSQDTLGAQHMID